MWTNGSHVRTNLPSIRISLLNFLHCCSISSTSRRFHAVFFQLPTHDSITITKSHNCYIRQQQPNKHREHVNPHVRHSQQNQLKTNRKNYLRQFDIGSTFTQFIFRWQCQAKYWRRIDQRILLLLQILKFQIIFVEAFVCPCTRNAKELPTVESRWKLKNTYRKQSADGVI